MLEKVPTPAKAFKELHGFFREKLQLSTLHMGNDAVPLQRRVVPIPYHSQRIGETVRLPPK